MRRVLCNILIIILAFVVQTSVFPFIPLLHSAPNLLIVIIFTIAFVYGEFEGVCYGVLAGLLMDMFYSGPFGYFTIIYGWIGFMNGFLSRFYYDDFIFLPVIMCCINEVIYNILLFIMYYILRENSNFINFFKQVMMPEVMLTVIFTLILYRPVLKLNKTMKKIDEDKRGKELAQ